MIPKLNGSPTTATSLSPRHPLDGHQQPHVVVVGTAATTILALSIAPFADGMKGKKVAKSPVLHPAAVSLARRRGHLALRIYASPPFKVGLLNQITKSILGVCVLCHSMGGERRPAVAAGVRGFGGINPPFSGFNTFLYRWWSHLRQEQTCPQSSC